MRTITVNGKKRRYKLTLGAMERLTAKYNTTCRTLDDELEYIKASFASQRALLQMQEQDADKCAHDLALLDGLERQEVVKAKEAHPLRAVSIQKISNAHVHAFFLDLLWEILVWPKPYFFKSMFRARLDIKSNVVDQIPKLTSIFMYRDDEDFEESGDSESKN